MEEGQSARGSLGRCGQTGQWSERLVWIWEPEVPVRSCEKLPRPGVSQSVGDPGG